MTKLGCNVKNCVHNADDCCCKVAIVMDRDEAKSFEQICCTSLDENRGARFTNLFKTPETRPEIACDAVRYVYNEEHRYSAKRIDISGDGTCDCVETKRNTSKVRQGYRKCRGSGVSPVSVWDGWRGGKKTRGDKGL